MFRNEPIYVLVNDPTDYTVLGVSDEESRRITEECWVVVNAPRPLSTGWWDDSGEFVPGLRWEHHAAVSYSHFAAGDSEGTLSPATPNDAKRVLR